MSSVKRKRGPIGSRNRRFPDLARARPPAYSPHPMGSSGQKRKGRQHLPKVGTAPERKYAQKHEREAVVENFGIREGQATGWAKILVWVLVVLLVVGSIGGLVALIFID